MTSDTAKHHGTVFFPFPNGNGLLYNLQGTAEPPDATASNFREIPCKTPHTELLKVKNWIRRPQRYDSGVKFIRILQFNNGGRKTLCVV
jgi:hydrocephalus-inducing protein